VIKKSNMKQRSETLFSKGLTTFSNIGRFYIDGFKEMTIGKTLWTIIIIKLFIIFFILKLFFFPNYLNSQCDNDDEKAQLVRKELINK
jgi:hypothetical protein